MLQSNMGKLICFAKKLIQFLSVLEPPAGTAEQADYIQALLASKH
jgi:hypothetical protein